MRMMFHSNVLSSYYMILSDTIHSFMMKEQLPSSNFLLEALKDKSQDLESGNFDKRS
jgi:hypothetical protein